MPPECRTLGGQNVSVAVADQSIHSADGSASVQVTLRDQQAPTVAWDNPPAQVNLSQGATLGVTVSDASSGVASVSLLAQQAQGTLAPTSRSIAGADLWLDHDDPQPGADVDARDERHGPDAGAGRCGEQLGAGADHRERRRRHRPHLDQRSAAAERQPPARRQPLRRRRRRDRRHRAQRHRPRSGIETAQLGVLVGGNTTVEGQPAGNSQVVFTTTVNYGVPGGLSDGAEIVITPQANDVSDATGLTAGAAITLVVDATPPTSAPSLIAPAAATTFGTPRSYCLNAGTLRCPVCGTADTVAVSVQVSPLPAGFPADGRTSIPRSTPVGGPGRKGLEGKPHRVHGHPA